MKYAIINTDTCGWLWEGNDRDEAMIKYGEYRLQHSCVVVWIMKQFEHQGATE